MARISTKQLFDEYFEGIPPTTRLKTRGQVDRPEVYAFEKKIGKQLIEMNADELLEMLKTFENRRKSDDSNAEYVMSYGSYAHISMQFRAIFDFYSEKYELIRNPWHSKEMRGVAALSKLKKDRSPVLTKAQLEQIYAELQNGAYFEVESSYYECFLRLFYEGFPSVEQIISIKEPEIDFKAQKCKEILLSDRCFELFQFIHGQEVMKMKRRPCILCSYHESYMKFPVLEAAVSQFQDRSLTYVANSINSAITKKISTPFGVNSSPSNVFYLGIYDKLCAEIGEKHARELLLATRDQEAFEEFRDFAQKLVFTPSVLQLKRALQAYLG